MHYYIGFHILVKMKDILCLRCYQSSLFLVKFTNKYNNQTEKTNEQTKKHTQEKQTSDIPSIGMTPGIPLQNTNKFKGQGSNTIKRDQLMH